MMNRRSLLFYFLLTVSAAAFAQPSTRMDKCDKVQSLLNWLPEVRGEQVNSNSYKCKDAYLLENFQTCMLEVQQTSEKKNWKTVQLSKEMPRAVADSVYLKLAHELVKCVYLNSWKASEEAAEDVYYFRLKQTISRDKRLKNIVLSMSRSAKSDRWKLQLVLEN